MARSAAPAGPRCPSPKPQGFKRRRASRVARRPFPWRQTRMFRRRPCSTRATLKGRGDQDPYGPVPDAVAVTALERAMSHRSRSVPLCPPWRPLRNVPRRRCVWPRAQAALSERQSKSWTASSFARPGRTPCRHLRSPRPVHDRPSFAHASHLPVRMVSALRSAAPPPEFSPAPSQLPMPTTRSEGGSYPCRGSGAGGLPGLRRHCPLRPGTSLSRPA